MSVCAVTDACFLCLTARVFYSKMVVIFRSLYVYVFCNIWMEDNFLLFICLLCKMYIVFFLLILCLCHLSVSQSVSSPVMNDTLGRSHRSPFLSVLRYFFQGLRFLQLLLFFFQLFYSGFFFGLSRLLFPSRAHVKMWCRILSWCHLWAIH